MIKVIDNIFDEQFLNYINHSLKFQYYNVLAFGHTNTSTTEHYTDIPQMISDSGPEQFDSPPYEFMFNTFLDAGNIINKNIFIRQRHVHLSPYGSTGPLHYDTDISDDLSFMFYPTNWDPKYEGGTLIKSDDGKEQIIEYKQNRLVIFPGNWWHQCLYHSNPSHRFTVVYFTYNKEEFNGNVKIV
jgi:hypothetical protein